jgi:hypothetical protein
VRRYTWFAILVLSGCAPPPAAVVQQPKPDPTTEAWYGQTVEQLAGMNRDAAKLLSNGKTDQAATMITAAQPIEARLLAVVHPTLRAMEAASDLDRMYGRMLLANRHDGWARLAFQKNLIRWKTWKPQTPETTRRLKQAESDIAECDRKLAQ